LGGKKTYWRRGGRDNLNGPWGGKAVETVGEKLKKRKGVWSTLSGTHPQKGRPLIISPGGIKTAGKGEDS